MSNLEEEKYKDLQDIVNFLRKNYTSQNQLITKITISLEVYDAEKGLNHGILISLPSQNDFFLEFPKKS